MPIHPTDTRIVTPKDGMVAVWGEGVLGGKLLLLRTTHPKVVLWNKQASAEKNKEGSVDTVQAIENSGIEDCGND